MRDQGGVTGIAGGDEDVAQKSIASGALDRRAGEFPSKRGIVQRQQLGQGRRDEVGSSSEPHLGTGFGKFIPGADRQAIVAAVDTVADLGSEFAINVALMLDR